MGSGASLSKAERAAVRDGLARIYRTVPVSATCEGAINGELGALEISNGELARSISRKRVFDEDDAIQPNIISTSSSKSLKMTWRRRPGDVLVVRTVAGEEVYGLTSEEAADLAVSALRARVAAAMVATGKDILPEAVRFIALMRPLEDGEQLATLLGQLSDSVLEVQALFHELPQFDAAQPVLEQLEALAIMLRSENAGRRLESVRQLRRTLSVDGAPPIQEVINAGIVPALMNLCDLSEPEDIQLEATWAITNVVSGNAEQTAHATENGGIQRFMALLASPSEDVREQCVWGLANFAGDGPAARDLVLGAGALTPLLEILNMWSTATGKMSTLRLTTWAISNLLRFKPQPSLAQVAPACGALVRLLAEHTDEEVLTDACWALSYLGDGPDDRIDVLVKHERACEHLARLLQEEQPLTVKKPALRCIGNIVTGNEQQTADALRGGALEAVAPMLKNPKHAIRKEAVWIISNILAGSAPQIQSVLDQNLVAEVLQLGRNSEGDIKKEVIWCLANLIDGGTHEQIEALVDPWAFEILTSVVQDVGNVETAELAMKTIVGIMSKRQQPLVDDGGPPGASKAAALLLEADGKAAINFALESGFDVLQSHARRLVEEFFPEMASTVAA